MEFSNVWDNLTPITQEELDNVLFLDQKILDLLKSIVIENVNLDKCIGTDSKYLDELLDLYFNLYELSHLSSHSRNEFINTLSIEQKNLLDTLTSLSKSTSLIHDSNDIKISFLQVGNNTVYSNFSRGF